MISLIKINLIVFIFISTLFVKIPLVICNEVNQTIKGDDSDFIRNKIEHKLSKNTMELINRFKDFSIELKVENKTGIFVDGKVLHKSKDTSFKLPPVPVDPITLNDIVVKFVTSCASCDVKKKITVSSSKEFSGHKDNLNKTDLGLNFKKEIENAPTEGPSTTTSVNLNDKTTPFEPTATTLSSNSSIPTDGSTDTITAEVTSVEPKTEAFSSNDNTSSIEPTEPSNLNYSTLTVEPLTNLLSLDDNTLAFETTTTTLSLNNSTLTEGPSNTTIIITTEKTSTVKPATKPFISLDYISTVKPTESSLDDSTTTYGSTNTASISPDNTPTNEPTATTLGFNDEIPTDKSITS